MRSGSDAWASSMASTFCPRRASSPTARHRGKEHEIHPTHACRSSASTPTMTCRPLPACFRRQIVPTRSTRLQAAFPACTTVAVVCAWFGNNISVQSCRIYPSTTYINSGTSLTRGAFQKWNGSGYSAEHWQCSSLNEMSAGLIPISSPGGVFTYGGTPCDQSIVECITDLRSRGLRVVFYPLILMDDGNKSWRGRISYFAGDVSSAATSAVNG